MKKLIAALGLLCGLLAATPALGVPRGTGKGGTAHDHHSFELRALDFNVVPWREPSEGHPWGTVRLGAFHVEDGLQPTGSARIVEWDLFTNGVVDELDIGGREGAHMVRIAKGSTGMVAVISTSVEANAVTQLVFLDERDRVKKVIDIEAVSHPAIAADGDLVAVAHFGWPNMLRTYRISTGEQLAKRAFPVREQPVLQPRHEPLFDVAVSGGDVFLLSTAFQDSRVERLSPTLTRRSVLTRRESFATSGVSFQPTGDRLTVTPDGVWVSWNDRIERLSPSLRREQRFELGAFQDAAAPRIALEPVSGRVATDDGRLAKSFGSELVPVVEFGGEIWHATPELPFYQDRLKDVVWAFGRVVIVRDAPGVGVTVIEPFE